jgi:hypothetical protein
LDCQASYGQAMLCTKSDIKFVFHCCTIINEKNISQINTIGSQFLLLYIFYRYGQLSHFIIAETVYLIQRDNNIIIIVWNRLKQFLRKIWFAFVLIAFN